MLSRFAGELRAPLAQRYSDFETRKKIWYEIVDSEVMELLAQGDEAGAMDSIARITKLSNDKVADKRR